jgi:hypothetical protein
MVVPLASVLHFPECPFFTRAEMSRSAASKSQFGKPDLEIHFSGNGV